MLDTIIQGDVSHTLSFFDSMHQLANLSLINRAFHSAIMNSRHSWLRIAVERTGFALATVGGSPEAKVYDEKSQCSASFNLSNPSEFWYKLKLLMCPWLSVSRAVIEVGPFENIYEEAGMYIRGEKLIAKIVDGDDADYYECEARKKNTKWAPIDFTPEDEEQVEQLQLTRHRNTSFRVHKNAIAVVETFIDDSLDGEGFRNGIYFVAGGRVLSHVVLTPIKFEREIAVCSAPCEVWFMANDIVHYFGPSDDREMMTHPSTLMGHAIHLIAVGDAEGAIAYLKRKGLSLDQPSELFDMTILHLAAENNNPDAIRTILDAGANPNALEISGISPLGTAALFCNVEAIEALNGRVDPNARNETNNTPIHWVGVFKYGNEAETLRALLRCGCDPRIVNSEGNSGVKELEKYGVEYEV